MKKYCNILFDLDGTLLPIDYEKFLYIYMKDLAEKFSKEGFEGKKIIQAVMKSTAAIMNNDGKMTNCQAFWQNLSELTDLQRDEIEPIFESYYENEYDAAALPSKKILRQKRCYCNYRGNVIGCFWQQPHTFQS